VSDRAVPTFDDTLDANGFADRFARGREVRKKGIQISKSLLLEHRELRGGLYGRLLLATLGAISSGAATLRLERS
jgi:hypothetical protein